MRWGSSPARSGGIVFGHYGDRVGRKRMLVVSPVHHGRGHRRDRPPADLREHRRRGADPAPGLPARPGLRRRRRVGRRRPHGRRARQGRAPRLLVELAAGRGARSATSSPRPCSGSWRSVQSDEAFTAWGWRIPFLLSAVMVLIGLWVRLVARRTRRCSPRPRPRSRRRGHRHLPILEVVRRYPKEVLLAMGMRMAENISYYVFTIVVITYVTTYLGAPPERRPRCAAPRRGPAVPPDPAARGALRPGRAPSALPRGRGRGRRLGLRVLLARRHPRQRLDPARGARRAVLPRPDVRPAGGVLLRAVRHVGALHRRVGRLPAGLDLRGRPRADHRAHAARPGRHEEHVRGRRLPGHRVRHHRGLGPPRQGDQASSLRHDRVLPGAHD